MRTAKVSGAVALGVVLAAFVVATLSALFMGAVVMVAVPLIGQVAGAQNPPRPGFWLCTGAALLTQFVVKALFGRK